MLENNITYLNNLDHNRLDNLVTETETSVQYFDEIIKDTVYKYTEHLDTIMTSIYNLIINVPDPPLMTIEKHFLELTNAIYFIGADLELLGIRDDISEAMYKEVYNKEYLEQQTIERDKKPTQSTLQALADNKALYENTLNAVYKRAYKSVKFKVDSASEMVRTLSKVMSKRMEEMKMTHEEASRVESTSSHFDDTAYNPDEVY